MQQNLSGPDAIPNVPASTARYWAGVTMASIFGASLGDFVSGGLLLALLAAWHERRVSAVAGAPA